MSRQQLHETQCVSHNGLAQACRGTLTRFALRAATLLTALFVAFSLGCSNREEDPPSPVPDKPAEHEPAQPANSLPTQVTPANDDPAGHLPAPDQESREETPAGPATGNEALLAGLASEDGPTRTQAYEQLAALGDESLPLLLSGMQSPSVEVRRGSAAALANQFREPPPEVVAVLVAALDDRDEVLRRLALQELSTLEGDAALPAVPRLAQVLAEGQENSQNRRAIARLIAKQGTAASDTLPQLTAAMLNDPDSNVRGAALFAVWSVATGPDKTLDAFRQVLRDDDSATLRRVAAMRIGGYGQAAAPAGEDLIAALSGDDEEVRLVAARALVQIGPASVPLLTEELERSGPESSDSEHLVLVALTLGDLGPAAAAAAPTLRELLESENERVRAAAQIALEAIGASP